MRKKDVTLLSGGQQQYYVPDTLVNEPKVQLDNRPKSAGYSCARMQCRLKIQRENWASPLSMLLTMGEEA